MTEQITFVPTPRLDYTLAYNKFKEDYQSYLLQQQREIDRKEQIRLETFNEKLRLVEKRMLNQELEDIRRYQILDKQKSYNDFKYAYWAGTLIDQYI